jgi:hypothetical protein
MRTDHEEHKEQLRSAAVGHTPKRENESAFAPSGGPCQDHAARLMVGEEMAFSIIIGDITREGDTDECTPSD